jgi:hypothetical protein
MTEVSTQVEDLKRYCDRVGVLTEGGVTFYLLEGLRLPGGCTPSSCDGLLCPSERDGYPSRLFFSVQIAPAYARNWNWNTSNARILERNWFAFSWKVEQATPTLVDLLIAHLNGFAKEK